MEVKRKQMDANSAHTGAVSTVEAIAGARAGVAAVSVVTEGTVTGACTHSVSRQKTTKKSAGGCCTHQAVTEPCKVAADLGRITLGNNSCLNDSYASHIALGMGDLRWLWTI